jgi:hypothetical protein
MSDPSELPGQYLSRGSVFDVMLDDRPLRWTIWDLEGCVGEISFGGGMWHSHPESRRVAEAEHESWQDAADAVIAA